MDSLVDTTKQVIARTETRTAETDVTIDGRGTVWATNNADIVAVHTPTGTLPPSLLLDGAPSSSQESCP